MVEGDHWIFLGLKWGCTKQGGEKIDVTAKPRITANPAIMWRKDASIVHANLGLHKGLFEAQATGWYFWKWDGWSTIFKNQKGRCSPHGHASEVFWYSAQLSLEACIQTFQTNGPFWISIYFHCYILWGDRDIKLRPAHIWGVERFDSERNGIFDAMRFCESKHPLIGPIKFNTVCLYCWA